MPAFAGLLRRLGSVYRAKLDDQLISTYFRALRPFLLADLETAADAWIAKETRFPRPAEWRGHLPLDAAVIRDVSVMTPRDARAYAEAEQMRWEGEPCKCHACREAGVDHRFLRFVPEFTPEDTDLKVYDPLRQRLVTAGHWAHGAELQRWYAAKDAYEVRRRELFGAPVPARATRTRKKSDFTPLAPTIKRESVAELTAAVAELKHSGDA